MIGAVLGGAYEVVRMVGEGGMGRVYEARHQRLPTKKFAVKMLHPDLARQPDVALHPVDQLMVEAFPLSDLVPIVEPVIFLHQHCQPWGQ